MNHLLLLPISSVWRRSVWPALFCLATTLMIAVGAPETTNAPARPSRPDETDKWQQLGLSAAREAAENGDMFAQYFLGVSYANATNGVGRNYSEAAKWIGKAAAQGFARAQHDMGVVYANGFGMPRDQTKAFEWFMKAAVQGHPRAEAAVAARYLRGWGVQRNDPAAWEWFLKSAEHGYAPAQVDAGFLRYEFCPDNLRDLEKAAMWYRRAADQGYADGCYRLGLLYLGGAGVESDEEQGLELMRKAADQEHAAATQKLAELYASGVGEPRGPNERPIDLLQRAAELGRHEAYEGILLRYSRGFGTDLNLIEAARWYCRAAEFDEGKAVNLRTLYNQDLRQAPKKPLDPFSDSLKVYISAARPEETEALLQIGAMFLSGRDVPRDAVAAWGWFSLAAQRGCRQAIQDRSNIAQQLTRDELTKANAGLALLTKELAAVAARAR